MDLTKRTDKELVDLSTEVMRTGDPTSEDFAIEHAGALALELEGRGFTESDGSWRHPEKGTLVADP